MVLPFTVFAEISLPALISDNMVLQQKTQAHLWGWAESGERVTVSISGTGMVTAIDVGEKDNVHPKDKKTVGERLAGWSLNPFIKRLQD